MLKSYISLQHSVLVHPAFQILCLATVNNMQALTALTFSFCSNNNGQTIHISSLGFCTEYKILNILYKILFCYSRSESLRPCASLRSLEWNHGEESLSRSRGSQTFQIDPNRSTLGHKPLFDDVIFIIYIKFSWTSIQEDLCCQISFSTYCNCINVDTVLVGGLITEGQDSHSYTIFHCTDIY